jgi:S1-C subfamily serine protease
MARVGNFAACAMAAVLSGCVSERLSVASLQPVIGKADCDSRLAGFSTLARDNRQSRQDRMFHLGEEAHRLKTLYPGCREQIDRIAGKAMEAPKTGDRQLIKANAAGSPRSQALPVVVSPQALPPWDNAKPTKPSGTAKTALAPNEVFAKANPSVYAVRAVRDPDAAVTSHGSAVAVSPKEAITNCHIVAQAKSIQLSSDEGTFAAELSSAHGPSDRCYLRVLNGTLHPVKGLRDFDSLAVGETVYTIGSPKGLDKTLGQGLLSGLRSSKGIEYIQITAPISEGSSGGGLFDDRANLIGITTFTIRDSQNLNFAIAASEYWR